MIAHFLYHWVYQDIWQPIWPNWAASFVITVFVLVKAKGWDERRKAAEAQRHSEQLAHIDKHMDALHKNLGIEQTVKVKHEATP